MTFKRRVLIALLAFLLGWVWLNSLPKASAISGVFPDQNWSLQAGEWTLLSQYGSGHYLETPTATIRFFYDTQSPAYASTTNFRVSINYLCRSSATNYSVAFAWNGGGTRTIDSECNNNGFNYSGTFELGGVSKSELKSDVGRYTARYKYIDLVGINARQPLLAFRATSLDGGGLGTFKEVDQDKTDNSYGSPINNYQYNQQPIGSAFALWDNRANNDDTTTRGFALDFKSSCNFDNSHDVFLRWYDADDGSVGTQTSANGGIKFQVFDITNGAPGFPATPLETSLGGNDVYKELKINVSKGHKYRWHWYNVSATNGVQLWMPFSNMNTRISCSSNPTTPTSSTSCTATTATDDGTKAYDATMVPRSPAPHGGTYDTVAAGTSLNHRTYMGVTDGVDPVLEPSTRIGSPVGDGSNVTPPTSVNWTYSPRGPTVTVTHAKQAYFPYKYNKTVTNADGSTTTTRISDNVWMSYPVDVGQDSTTYVCYSASSATCSIDVDANVPGTDNGVQGGQSFAVHATITNTGDINLPSSLGGRALSITGNGYWAASGTPLVTFPTTIAPGDDYTVDFTLTAPLDTFPYTLGDRPAYSTADGASTFYLGPPCTVNTPTYLPFDITPSASMAGTDIENPKNVYYQTSGYNSKYVVNAIAQSWLTKKVSGGTPNTVDGIYAVPHTYNTATSTGDSFVYPNASIVLGDEYCAHVTIDPAVGWVGPSGVIASGSEARTANSTCAVVHNEPYVHVFNSGVQTGGDLEGTTCAGDGPIKTYSSTTYTSGSHLAPIGSGAQFDAVASGQRSQISGFSSALLRTTTTPEPLGSIGLTFANTSTSGISGGDENEAKLGGNYGANRCETDYFKKQADDNVPDDSTNLPTRTLSSIADGKKYYNLGGAGTLTINTTDIGSQNSVIYVNGNVNIKGNITESTSWSLDANGAPKVPSLYIIAKGNIFIDPSVTRLDGVYIAQKDAMGNKGTIHTCTTDTLNGNPPANWVADCSKQLVINGAFVANKVKFQRTLGSLRNSKTSERFDDTAAARACDQGADSKDCAAEIFIFRPEIYISKPAFPASSGASAGTYDYITSLSPVL